PNVVVVFILSGLTHFRFYYKIAPILFNTNCVPDTAKNLALKTQKAYNAKTSVFIWTLSI
ncbi:MAG: hypothetical protein MJE68_06495, partial [Proteobacteria bacterium]|nr:hypothetical protein [Pseudomonadota bacterium]